MHRPEGGSYHVTSVHSFPLLNTDVEQFQNISFSKFGERDVLEYSPHSSIGRLLESGRTTWQMSERKQVAFTTQEAILDAISIRTQHRVSLCLNLKYSES
jgi:hypothetical protein